MLSPCPSQVCFSTKVSSGNSGLGAINLRDHVAIDPFQRLDEMQDIEMVVASERVKLGRDEEGGR